MASVIFYTMASVFIVSLISLIGIVTLSIKISLMKKIILYFVSFAAGALFGNAILHLIPEAFETGTSFMISIFILLGILSSFFIEKVIQWRHNHYSNVQDKKYKPFTYISLVGDSVHNLVDGLIIGGSYIASIPLGITTTLSVILHEIPQEIGDFAILLKGGFSKVKALFYNFLTALAAVVGALLALFLTNYIFWLTGFLIPFAAGTFIYIAGSDLIPNLNKEHDFKKSVYEFLLFLLGIFIMGIMLFI